MARKGTRTQRGTRFGLLSISAVLLLWAAPVGAAQLYGRITEVDGSPVGDASVRIVCDGQEIDSGRTDRRGRYRLFVARVGACTIQLPDRGNASGEIVSYQDPARFNYRLTGKRLERI